MTDPVCPATGAPMRRGVRPLDLTYKGLTVTVDMPGWYSGASDEGIHTGADMQVSDRALNRLKARAEGLLDPADIRRIRKRLGLTQAAAGELIGGGPRAFQKYEAGDLLPSRAVSSALRLLDRDPGALAVLSPAPTGSSSRLNTKRHDTPPAPESPPELLHSGVASTPEGWRVRHASATAPGCGHETGHR